MSMSDDLRSHILHVEALRVDRESGVVQPQGWPDERSQRDVVDGFDLRGARLDPLPASSGGWPPHTWLLHLPIAFRREGELWHQFLAVMDSPPEALRDALAGAAADTGMGKHIAAYYRRWAESRDQATRAREQGCATD